MLKGGLVHIFLHYYARLNGGSKLPAMLPWLSYPTIMPRQEPEMGFDLSCQAYQYIELQEEANGRLHFVVKTCHHLRLLLWVSCTSHQDCRRVL